MTWVLPVMSQRSLGDFFGLAHDCVLRVCLFCECERDFGCIVREFLFMLVSFFCVSCESCEI